MKFKNASELEVLNQREILHNAIRGRVMLKTILSGNRKSRKQSSSSSNSSKNGEETNLLNHLEYNSTLAPVFDPNWYAFPYQMHANAFYPPVRGGFRGGRGLRHMAGPSRGKRSLLVVLHCEFSSKNKKLINNKINCHLIGFSAVFIYLLGKENF